MDVDTCWICLEPFDENVRTERKKPIKACSCSLVAHKGCLMDWLNSKGDLHPRNQYYVPGLPMKRYFTLYHKCPQCNEFYMVGAGGRYSWFLNIERLIESFTTKTVMLGVATMGITTVLSSVVVGVASFMGVTGLKLWQTLAPESVLLKQLGILTEKTLQRAFDKDKINAKHVAQIASFPVYLLSFRSSNSLLSLYRGLYPVTFIEHVDQLYSNLGVTRYLLFAEPLKYLYEMLFSVSINRIYRSWIYDILPYKAAEKVSLRCDFSRPLLGPNYQWTTLATTFIWPFAGQFIGSFLIKSPQVRHILNMYVQTPDEGTYVCNLIGCCISILVKDLFNLYKTWRLIQQLRSIEVADEKTKFQVMMTREEYDSDEPPQVEEEEEDDFGGNPLNEAFDMEMPGGFFDF